MRRRAFSKRLLRRLKPRFWSRLWRRRRSKKITARGLAFVVLSVVLIGMVYQTMHPAIDPSAYTPLLNTIAKGESNGNYNAYFGNAANKAISFTKMPVGEVLQWQDDYVRQGSASNAVGRYQIIRPTLAGLVQQLGIDPQTRFDERLQNRMAIALLERRGSVAFAEKKISREQFAANLSQEWAALPKTTGPNPTESYYAADGINKSRITIDDLYAALDSLQS
jgi:muramidase (phage lysozyme)